MIRAAIYARYSTTHQREASIEDQSRNCERYAADRGWQIVARYHDKAMSGTSANRPQYQRMLNDAAAEKFDVLLVDDLSRLSRDDIETKTAVRRLTFAGIQVVGVSDGYDSSRKGHKLNLGLRALMNEAFIDDHTEKVHRGMEGRVLAGYSGGGKAYGYGLNKTDNGTLFEIDPEQAKWVRFAFEKFAEGRSSRWIAYELNRWGVPGPTGGKWAHTSIYGGRNQQRGFLNNQLYNGRYVWNKTEMVKDPLTGRRLWRPRPEKEWRRITKPELKIIPDDLWRRVKERQQRNFAASANRPLTPVKKRNAKTLDLQRPWRAGGGRPPKYLLTGVAKCGVCRGSFTVHGPDQLRCATNHSRGPTACSNDLKVKRSLLEDRVLAAIKDELFTTNQVAAFSKRLRNELATSGQNANPEIADLRRNEQRIQRQIANVVNAVAEGDGSKALTLKLRDLEAEQASIRHHIEGIEASAKAIDLLPAMLNRRDDVLADIRQLAERDMWLAQNHVKELVGGTIMIYPRPDRSAIAVLRGAFVGLLAVLDQLNNVEYRVARTIGLRDEPKRAEVSALIGRLRDLMPRIDEDATLRGAVAWAGVDPKKLLKIMLVAEERYLLYRTRRQWPPKMLRNLKSQPRTTQLSCRRTIASTS